MRVIIKSLNYPRRHSEKEEMDKYKTCHYNIIGLFAQPKK